MDTLGYIAKGAVATASDKEHTYQSMGTVEIVDKDDDEIKIEDIIQKADIMKARGNGKILVTDGHLDLVVGHVTKMEKVMVAKDGEPKPGLKLEYTIPDWGPTSREIWADHEAGRVHGMSIRGKILKGGSKIVCEDDSCHREITKGEWFSFALCRRKIKPRNQLARRIDNGDVEILKKAREHMEKNGLDGNCAMCQETVDYYVNEGMELEKAQELVRHTLLKTEESSMDEEATKLLEKLASDMSEIRKSLTEKQEEPEQAPEQEPMGLSKADVEELIKPLTVGMDELRERMENLEKAREDTVVKDNEPEPEQEPEPEEETDEDKETCAKGDEEEAEDGVTDDVVSNDNDMEKGAFQGAKKENIPTREDIMKSVVG